MSKQLLLGLALLALASMAAAQNPRVLLDTDRGPMLLELDSVRAPNTVANFLSYVDDGAYNRSLIQRVVPNFVVQGGGFKESGEGIVKRAAIPSERGNGLQHTTGTVAMALTSTNGVTNVNSATSDFFINTNTNASLNADFTVFGRVVYGYKTLEELNTTPIFFGSEQPIRMPLIRRAVRVASDEFPILPLHTGTWFDPDNSGKGFLIEITKASGATNSDSPILVVSWYDFFEGQQFWTIGSAPFAWGASSVEIPMQISTGGQFGSAYMASQVTSNPQWGVLTIRFSDCSIGSFSYTSVYGNGTIPVRSLTSPLYEKCPGS